MRMIDFCQRSSVKTPTMRYKSRKVSFLSSLSRAVKSFTPLIGYTGKAGQWSTRFLMPGFNVSVRFTTDIALCIFITLVRKNIRKTMHALCHLFSIFCEYFFFNLPDSPMIVPLKRFQCNGNLFSYPILKILSWYST